MRTILTSLVFSFLLLFTGCKKHSDNPIDQLPPETQSGKNTFGCLINGEVFTPRKSYILNSVLQAAYQYIDDPYVHGGYCLGIGASDEKSNPKRVISIGADSVKLNVGTFQLGKRPFHVNGYLGGAILFMQISQLYTIKLTMYKKENS